MSPDDFEKMQTNREMTKEEFEFYEDMLGLSEQSSKSEESLVLDDFAITNKGDVKIRHDLEYKKYIDARNKQKIEKEIKRKSQKIKDLMAQFYQD